ncbi:MAG TPA: carboxypeptidase-like regulatory domain-containing protein [Candidatus Paceibacterota bacterium]|nr:carboxypeptidase-like regulatory domain-containing protein [Candidatus Paceibacterota bacterium]
MKRNTFRNLILGVAIFVVAFFARTAIAASGVIDPNNAGNYKAAFLDSGIMSDTSINFGKFTTESAYNITVTDSALTGYAWGSSVGWMVMNCVNTTSGCSSTNGNFKVANDGNGNLSGYAWGENAGWINFGPFTDTAISTVKINTTNGNFGGSLGSAGYAWSQNFGWIKFDCTNGNTCVNTDWRPAGGGGGGGGGGGPTGGGGSSSITVIASSIVCDADSYMPHWGSPRGNPITSTTAATYVANSGGHCHFVSGQSYQWGTQTSTYIPNYGVGAMPGFNTFGATDNTGYVTTSIPIVAGTDHFVMREVMQPGFIPFTFEKNNYTNVDPNSAEFYCASDVVNYDNKDNIFNPSSGSTYYCVSFNVPTGTNTPVTPPSNPPTPPVVPPNYVGLVASSVVCDSEAAMPKWGATGNPNIGPMTAINYVNNSGGHCQLTAGQSFQWAPSGNGGSPVVYGLAPSPYVTFGPTNSNGYTSTITNITTGNPIPLREVLQPGYNKFSLPTYGDNKHFPTSEFYCETDGVNFDNVDFIKTQVSQQTYYCISFNIPLATTPVTPPTPPQTPTTPPVTPPVTPPTNPPSNPGNPGTPGNPGQPTTPPGGGPGTTPPPTTQPPNGPAQSTDEPPFGGGLIFPPGLIDSITGAVTTAFGAIGKVMPSLGIATTAFAGLVSLFVASPFALAQLLTLPFRLWTLLLVFFGYKKKEHPWGTVYDSVTKQPIDPAYVVLMDMQGNEISTNITDIDGRYGFSVPAGTYKIVANKTNYEFPSKKLFGKTEDELYKDLYFGEALTTTKEGEVIFKNIPMDQLNFDWNEFAKNEQKRLSYYRRSDLWVARIANFFYWLGFLFALIAVISAHTLYNSIIFIIYILIYFIRRSSRQFQAKGSVTDAFTGDPLPFAIVHVLSIATSNEVIHKVADRLGNYYCLVPNGHYNIVIDKKNPDGSYTKIPVSGSVEVTRGYLKKNFKI